MATDIISTKFSVSAKLDTELENARATLRGVEDSIKKVFGKEASELNAYQQRPPRRSFQTEGRIVLEVPFGGHQHQDHPAIGFRTKEYDKFQRRRSLRERDTDNYTTGTRDDEPIDKRRRFGSDNLGKRQAPIVLSSRLIKPDPEEQDFGNGEGQFDGNGAPQRFRDGGRDIHQRLQSRVVSSVKEKSREEVLAEQRQDRSGRDRNRRMFGALLGTLHQFKQDETKLKEKEEKRAQIEAKLEEQALQEKETVKKEKQKLIRDHKLKVIEIKRLEYKKHRLEQLEEWEGKTKYLRNFIRTEAKPNIFYLPKQMNPIAECRLDESKQIVEEMIATKRKSVLSELEKYEEQNRRYWGHGQDTVRQIVDPLDVNMEDELRALMKDENSAKDEITVSVSVNENAKRIVSVTSVAADESQPIDESSEAKDATSEVTEDSKQEPSHEQAVESQSSAQEGDDA